MQHTQATCGFTPQDMFLQQSSIGFDMTLAEIWLPFSVGASILPAEARAQQDGPRLLRQISRHPVTVICPVPSELFMWLESGLTRSHAPSVRWLMTGAEALSPALLSRAQAALPGVRTLNMYGPTEVRNSTLVLLTITPVAACAAIDVKNHPLGFLCPLCWTSEDNLSHHEALCPHYSQL